MASGFKARKPTEVDEKMKKNRQNCEHEQREIVALESPDGLFVVPVLIFTSAVLSLILRLTI